VSPPLRGEAGLAQVQLACTALRRMGAKPNRSCGLHVHHEIRDLDVASIKRFVRSYANNQDLIDGLVSPSRRHGQNTYCLRLDETARTFILGRAVEFAHAAVM